MGKLKMQVGGGTRAPRCWIECAEHGSKRFLLRLGKTLVETKRRREREASGTPLGARQGLARLPKVEESMVRGGRRERLQDFWACGGVWWSGTGEASRPRTQRH